MDLTTIKKEVRSIKDWNDCKVLSQCNELNEHNSRGKSRPDKNGLIKTVKKYKTVKTKATVGKGKEKKESVLTEKVWNRKTGN